MVDRGVIYVAVGKQYIEEAVVSARSLKECMDDVHITIYTDTQIDTECFDEIKLIDETRGDYGDSIIRPEMLQYERTLFLDTDTFVTSDVSELFKLLDRFDIAAVHNPGSRTTDPSDGQPAQGVPDSFPLYNTGVLVMNRSETIKELLKEWANAYYEHVAASGKKLNQPAFREAVYHSGVKIGTLPPEYNCRVRYDGSAGALTDEVKIVHGRHPMELGELAEELNSTIDLRAFSYKKYPLRVDTRAPNIRFYLNSLLYEDWEDYTYRGRFLRSIRERGFTETIKRVGRDLRRAIYE